MTGIQPKVQFGGIYVVSREKSELYRERFGHVWDGAAPIEEWFQVMDVFTRPLSVETLLTRVPIGVENAASKMEPLPDGRTLIITDDGGVDDIKKLHEFGGDNWSNFTNQILADPTLHIFRQIYGWFLEKQEAEERQRGITPGGEGSRIHYIG